MTPSRRVGFPRRAQRAGAGHPRTMHRRSAVFCRGVGPSPQRENHPDRSDFQPWLPPRGPSSAVPSHAGGHFPILAIFFGAGGRFERQTPARDDRIGEEFPPSRDQPALLDTVRRTLWRRELVESAAVICRRRWSLSRFDPGDPRMEVGAVVQTERRFVASVLRARSTAAAAGEGWMRIGWAWRRRDFRDAKAHEGVGQVHSQRRRSAPNLLFATSGIWGSVDALDENERIDFATRSREVGTPWPAESRRAPGAKSGPRAVIVELACNAQGAGRADRQSSPRQSPSAQVEIQPERGCHAAVTRLYPPLARKRDHDRRRGGRKALAFFGKLR